MQNDVLLISKINYSLSRTVAWRCIRELQFASSLNLLSILSLIFKINMVTLPVKCMSIALEYYEASLLNYKGEK